jgi:hypothetical protein
MFTGVTEEVNKAIAVFPSNKGCIFSRSYPARSIVLIPAIGSGREPLTGRRNLSNQFSSLLRRGIDDFTPFDPSPAGEPVFPRVAWLEEMGHPHFPHPKGIGDQ